MKSSGQPRATSPTIVVAAPGEHRELLRELTTEYLQWGNGMLEREFNISFDIAAMIESDMADLKKFFPPRGRTLLGFVDGQPAGLACLKELAPSIGEVKRMYVRPAIRRAGLGRALLERLMHEARGIGYERLRLDSARFMHDAHRLYRAMGFHEIEPYDGSEITDEYRHRWVFMELSLTQGGEKA